MADSSLASTNLPPAEQSGETQKKGIFSRLRLDFLLGWVLPGLIILAGLLYWALPKLLNPPAAENAPMPQSAAFEERWGIRITQVAVTADGGMVDLRYVILDSSKAQQIGVDTTTTPKLIPEDNKTTVFQTARMSHKNEPQAGTTYFLLYENAGGAVKAHSFITIQLGDLTINHVPVR